MISIKENVSELERSYEARRVVVECYIEALRNMSNYAVELEPEVTRVHRQHLNELADDVSTDRQQGFEESRATLRGLLRNYRDKGAQYLGGLREQLSSTVESLENLLQNMAEGDGNHETGLRSSIAKLRELCHGAPSNPFSRTLLNTADALDRNIEEMRKQHGFTISQLQMEIRSLQKRIQQLETAAAIDEMTRLFSRSEMEAKIRILPSGKFSFLLMKCAGFRLAQVHFSLEVVAELAAAFARRLRGSLPPESILGRWSEEEFIAVLPQGKSETLAIAKWISEHLSGTYSCIDAGKTVNPKLQLTVAVVDNHNVPASRVLEKISEFLTGG
jgi:GGDEF domain-containing protein